LEKLHSKTVYFVKDSPINNWIKQEFERYDLNTIYIGIKKHSQYLEKSRLVRIVRLHLLYLRSAVEVIIRSKKNDIIVSFLDIHGLYIYLIGKLFLQKRYYIPLNIMINNNADVINKIKLVFYRFYIGNKMVYPTVSSSYLQEKYRLLLNLAYKEFYILHDSYGQLDELETNSCQDEEYCFCGGTNGRDWDFLYLLAEELPEINFVLIGAGVDFSLDHNLPNIKYFFNIPFNEFNKKLSRASVLLMPLKTEAPAGLIVLYSAALLSKPVIISDTLTTKEYVFNGENGFLIYGKDVEKWKSTIRFLMNNPNKRIELGKNNKKKMKQIGSPELYIKDLVKFLEKVMDENSTN